MIIAFSMYSRIPMPIFNWDEKDMKHVIAFLPFIGAVIGVLDYALLRAVNILGIPCMVLTLMLVLIPVLITGGFHIDGFMDVQDALKSYQSKEKKLEIMKDPHIGAFAVISVMSLGLMWLAALYFIAYKAMENGGYGLLYSYAVAFSLVRSVCGITCVALPNAKKDGMLDMETKKTGKHELIFLVIESVICLVIMLGIEPVAAVLCALAITVYSFIYKRICDRNFGGITGDTSGYFIVTGECVFTVALAILSFWG